MLKKKLCKRCWNSIFLDGWNEYDEWLWEKEIVCCPGKYLTKGEGDERKITKEPPTNCPFILEHILTNQKED